MIRLIGTTWKHSDVLSEGVLIGRVPMGNGVHRPKCPKLTHCFVARAKNNTHWTLCPVRIIFLALLALRVILNIWE